MRRWLSWVLPCLKGRRHEHETERLRRAERREFRAAQRAVDVGVQATLSAEAARESAENLADRLEGKPPKGGARVLMTAERVLELIDRGWPR